MKVGRKKGKNPAEPVRFEEWNWTLPAEGKCVPLLPVKTLKAQKPSEVVQAKPGRTRDERRARKRWRI